MTARHRPPAAATPGRASVLPVPAWLRRLILIVGFLALAGYYIGQPPMAQNPDYHRFADWRTVFGVVNGLNVLSNIPFLLVGIAGIRVVFSAAQRSALGAAWLVWPYVAFFMGVALTAFGSTYYHLSPDNHTLVWDRLPMAIGFTGLLSAVVGERVSRKSAQVLIAPLLLAGLASVIYWHVTEQLGRGDLRPYLVVQYGSLELIALLMLLYPARWTHAGYLWAGFTAYAIAKLFEVADHQLFAIGQVVSGHTLKHLAAAGGVACIVRMIWVRTDTGLGLS